MSEPCFLSIGICQGTAFQQILWASWVEASEAQVLPVPLVPGCSQSQFTEFTFTQFTVRVPQRNRSASFQSFHSFFSFTSFSSDSFDSFDSFLSLGLLGLRLTKWLEYWVNEVPWNSTKHWNSTLKIKCPCCLCFSCHLSKEQLADGASGLLWRLWNLPLSHQTPQSTVSTPKTVSVNHLWMICEWSAPSPPSWPCLWLLDTCRSADPIPISIYFCRGKHASTLSLSDHRCHCLGAKLAAANLSKIELWHANMMGYVGYFSINKVQVMPSDA